MRWCIMCSGYDVTKFKFLESYLAQSIVLGWIISEDLFEVSFVIIGSIWNIYNILIDLQL